ncbi:CoA transferase [Microcella alkalica]|uniref:Formyl-CoA transferase n=1 Tax=Microcella alkalica TaxID=355930 RepID=A0A839EB86_9MICO|nr:CoA transferase [Microcella alkalica]MBA8847504.1 formyl-CoA transferase [Microcella alkalica]
MDAPKPAHPHTANRSPRPLDGIRVLELGTLIAGPMSGRILADFGAEVIKIESPDAPDPMRSWGHVVERGESLWWAVQSRGKRSLMLDLKDPQGNEVFRRLVREADVLVENMRPGTLERLGCAPDELMKLNPGLIVARVSGYGQTGPRSGQPGYASVAEAAGGLRHLNGYPDTPPPRAGISLGDSLAALYAVQGILTALYWRDARGGTGQVVDVSLTEACFSMLEAAVPEYAATGRVPHAMGSRLDGISPSNIYRSGDGDWVVIAANQNTVFARLCKAMGRPELAADPKFADHTARGRNQDELDAIVAEWSAGFTTPALLSVLDRHGVPNSRVNTVADIAADDMFRERDMLVEVPHPRLGAVTHPGIVPKLSATPGVIRANGPTEGEHTRQVLRDAGFDDEQIRRLTERGVAR